MSALNSDRAQKQTVLSLLQSSNNCQQRFTMNDDFGIMYVAVGKQFRAECIRSAKSAKKVMPDIPISVWTEEDAGQLGAHFDSVHILPNPTFTSFDKIPPLLDTGYEKTLFLDTDTYFMDSVHEISSLLEDYELAYAHAPWRISSWESHLIEGLPICFPEANTGVIAYRRNERVLQLIRDWILLYQEQAARANKAIHDQPAFRRMLYFSDVRAAVLPPEYNMRTVYPVFKGGGCPAKILHGREPSLSRAIQLINTDKGISIYNFNE